MSDTDGRGGRSGQDEGARPGGAGPAAGPGRRERTPGEDGEDSAGGWLTVMMRQAGPYMTAAYTLTGGLIGLGLIGYFLDHWLGTGPAFLLSGLGVGLVVGFYELAKVTFRGSGRR